MTNEEKALEIGTKNGLKYWFGKDEQDEKIISSVQSAFVMAQWKDQQFKEYLKKKIKICSKEMKNARSIEYFRISRERASIYRQIINELFKED